MIATDRETLVTLGGAPLLVMLDDAALTGSTNDFGNMPPVRAVRAAVAALARHAQHRVYVLSGHPRTNVLKHLDVPPDHVVGKLGLEWPDVPLPSGLREEAQTLLRRLEGLPSVSFDDRTFQVTVHVHPAPFAERTAVRAALAALPLPHGWEGVPGEWTYEYRPVGLGQGRATWQLARAHVGRRPVFVGGAPMAEAAFAVADMLGGVGVKVGVGATCARYRLPDPADVAELLDRWAAQPVAPPERPF